MGGCGHPTKMRGENTLGVLWGEHVFLFQQDKKIRSKIYFLKSKTLCFVHLIHAIH